VQLVTDAEGNAPHLELADAPQALPDAPSSLAERVVEELRRAPRPLTREALRARVRSNNQRLGELLEQLAAAGRVRRSAKGWSPA
jgi:hypothetical protein